MKRILITGKNSYVGNSFEKWLDNYPGQYEVNKISVRDDSWEEHDFSSYDVILHVAGIAHRKENKMNSNLYYKINRDLAYKVAIKAKNEGVTHFLFLSSMSVYGWKKGVITKDIKPNPKSNYGKSKLEAEILIKSLCDGSFKVAILRPPMIYGKGCTGNYSKLSKTIMKAPIFPRIVNKRSMIYIENLTEFIRLLIDNKEIGLFWPQNKEYVCTTEMVKLIAQYNGKNIWITSLFNIIVIHIKSPVLDKLFGDLVYEKSMSELYFHYQKVDFETSILLSEREL